MKNTSAPIISVCVLLCLYTPSRAIAGTTVGITSINDTVGAATTDNVTSAPTGDASQISAGTKDKNASLQISLPGLSSGSSDSIADVVISAPLDSNNEGQLATLDGFSKTYSAQINYKQSVFNQVIANPQVIYMKCVEIAKEIDSSWKDGPCGLSVLHALRGKNSQKQSSQTEKKVDGDIDDYKDAAFGSSVLNFWGVTATGGDNNYQYITANSATQQTTNQSSIAASGYYGVLTKDSGLVSAEIKWQKTPKEGKTETICAAPIANTPVMCTTAALNAPQTQYSSIVSVGYRNDFEHFAMSPSINYDMRQHVLGIDLPFYLIRDSSSNYNGGIRLGWRNDTHEITGILFIGTSFNYFSE